MKVEKTIYHALVLIVGLHFFLDALNYFEVLEFDVTQFVPRLVNIAVLTVVYFLLEFRFYRYER